MAEWTETGLRVTHVFERLTVDGRPASRDIGSRVYVDDLYVLKKYLATTRSKHVVVEVICDPTMTDWKIVFGTDVNTF